MTRSEPFIEIKDLSFCYPGSGFSLKQINLDVFLGERLALTGANGAGKSTLARHLIGLLRPLSGSIKIDGKDTKNQTVARLSGQTALLFQNPDDQICRRNVWDEIAFGPRNLGYDAHKVQALVKDALDGFELDGFSDKNPHDLNYSERKRVALASVVAMDTRVLMLDEPTAGLDPSQTLLLVKVMQTLSAQGKILIIITHDMDFLAEQIPRIVCLNQGEKQYDGDTRTLFSQEELMNAAGLYPPQMVRLSNHFNDSTPAMSPGEFVSKRRISL